MGIVEQITTALKAKIVETIPELSQLDYEYNVLANADERQANRFGVVVGASNFVNGRSVGFITIDQQFQVLLTDDTSNRDGDESQRAKVFKLYDNAYKLLRVLHSKKLSSTPEYQVLLISAISFEEMEFLDDNKSIALRLNLNIQYKFKNNC